MSCHWNHILVNWLNYHLINKICPFEKFKPVYPFEYFILAFYAVEYARDEKSYGYEEKDRGLAVVLFATFFFSVLIMFLAYKKYVTFTGP